MSALWVGAVCFIAGAGWGAGIVLVWNARQLEREMEREDAEDEALG